MKLSEELKHCLDGGGCKDCESYEINSVLTCRGLLQAAYEQIKGYEELEDQGLLLKLPCKVGDTLYSVSFRKKCRDQKENGGYLINSNIECIACEFSDCACGSKEEYFIEEIKATLPMIANLINPSKDFNIFLTRKQAEAELKKNEEVEEQPHKTLEERLQSCCCELRQCEKCKELEGKQNDMYRIKK